MELAKVRKTPKMLAVEKKYDDYILRIVTRVVNEHGVVNGAKELGISKALMGYWMLKLGVTYHRVAVAPDEEIQIRKKVG